MTFLFIFMRESGERDLVDMEIPKVETPLQSGGRRHCRETVSQAGAIWCPKGIASQLRRMQATGVIEPSNSPRACAVVVFRKKDGSSRFHVDYSELNSATKSDEFPLPGMDAYCISLGKQSLSVN